jgi:hypothetical protein
MILMPQIDPQPVSYNYKYHLHLAYNSTDNKGMKILIMDRSFLPTPSRINSQVRSLLRRRA